MRRRAGLLLAVATIALGIAPIRGDAIVSLRGPLCGTTAGSSAPEETTLRAATLNVLHGLEETPNYPTHSTFEARLELQAHEIIAEGVD
ncbi:MAG: hypothetical protein ACRDKS_15240, partial [Actinomycetota bacterium]